MTLSNSEKSISVLNKDLRLLWKISAFLYIVCNMAFASQSYLMMLNSYALYFFLGVSALCILVRGSLKFNAYSLSMIAFFLISMLGCLYSASSYAMTFLYDLFVVICITFCLVNFIETEEDISFLFKALMIGGLVLNVYVVSIYGSGFIDAIMNETRVGEVAGNANDVGLKSCYGALIALYFFLNEKSSKIKKLLYLAACAIGVFFSFITASKKVLILLVFGFTFLFFFREHKKKGMASKIKNTLIVVLIVGVFLYMVYNVSAFALLRSRIEEFFDLLVNGGGNSGDNNRKYFIEEGFRLFTLSPFIGEGTAASYSHFGTYSHCNFVEVLMNNGIVGFIVFYFSYPIIYYRCLASRSKANNSNKKMTILCLFIFTSIVILSVALVYITFIYYQVLLTIAATYVLKFASTEEDEA